MYYKINIAHLHMEARSGQNCNNKIAPQVSFFSHCCTFYQPVVYFHRRYSFFGGEVAYYFKQRELFLCKSG